MKSRSNILILLALLSSTCKNGECAKMKKTKQIPGESQMVQNMDMTTVNDELSIDEHEDNLEEILEKKKSNFENADKLVSLTVNQSTSVQHIVMEIAQATGIDFQLDPEIDSKIILRVTNRPLSEVLDLIAENANILYSVENGIIKFKRDEKYIKNYHVDFLNVTSSASGSFSADAGALAGSAGGSSSSISSSYENTLWQQLEDGIRAIIDYNMEVPQESSGQFNIASNILGESLASLASPSDKQQSSGIGKAQNNAGKGDDNANFSINKQAGIITVFAKSKPHKDIEEYINKVKISSSLQINIEAKIVEIKLNNENSSGIDWSAYEGSTLESASNFVKGVFGAPTLPSGDQEKIQLKFVTNVLGHNLNAGVSFLERFGETRVISSPIISATNNQPSVITFVKNHTHFQIKITNPTSTSTSGGTTTTNNSIDVTSEAKTTPVGIILAIHPTVDLSTKEISMHIRPTISRIVGSVSDPAVAFASAKNSSGVAVKNLLPIVEVRSMDSNIRTNSGAITIIGGLREKRTDTTERGVPLFKNIPIFGQLFKSNIETSENVETLILIKATIINPNEESEFSKYF